MMKAKLGRVLCVLSLVLLVNGTPEFNICPSSVCLSQPVNYVCTVTGEATFQWRVNDASGDQVGDTLYGQGSDVGAPENTRTLATQFTTILTDSAGPIVSNISFTPLLNISNYTIGCAVSSVSTPVNCTILIEGIPSSVVPNVSFTSSTLDLSWLPSASNCLSHYTISLTSISSTIDITDTSLSFSVLTLNSTQYSISVAAVDRAGRSMTPQTVSFIPDAPLSVTNLMLRATDYPNDVTNTSVVNVTASWTAPPSSSRPAVSNYTIIHNVTTPDTTITVPAPTSTLTITGATVGSVYTVQVLASNVLGTGPAALAVITIPFSPLPDDEMSSSIIIPTMSGTSDDTGDTGDDVIVIVIPVVLIVLIIILLPIIILVLYYLYRKNKGKGRSEAGSSGHWKRKEVAPQQDEQANYSQVEHSKKSSSSGSRQKPQEPSVQYSAVQQLQYAELSHASSKGSSTKPQPKGPQVQYSSVKPH